MSLKAIKSQGVNTENGTCIDATLIPVKMEGPDGRDYGYFHHLEMNFWQNTDTDLFVTTRINTITSQDLYDLADVFVSLANKLKKRESA